MLSVMKIRKSRNEITLIPMSSLRFVSGARRPAKMSTRTCALSRKATARPRKPAMRMAYVETSSTHSVGEWKKSRTMIS